jgi:hypothetical protein
MAAVRGEITNAAGFVEEHFKLAVFVAALGAFYVGMGDHFAELVYGSLRLGAVMLSAFAVISIVFKHTVWPYIAAGGLVKDFEALDPVRKVWAALGVVLAVVWVATECFVHA